MIWKARNHQFDLTSHALVMGILNVTLESFSDGGKYSETAAAVAHGLQMEAEGAAIIDVGGESTRPGAEPVPVEEELRRVVPVIQSLAGQLKLAVISVDTSKAAVAEAALQAGASIINDVTALRGDTRMAEVAKAAQAGVVAMHMKGTPRDMQRNPEYRDVTGEVGDFLRQTTERLLACGLDPLHLVLDPGIGFGKTVEHNLTLLRDLPALQGAAGERPLLLGVSRKAFLGRIVASEAIADREVPTQAITAMARTAGVKIFRVHSVKPNVQAVRTAEAILKGGVA